MQQPTEATEFLDELPVDFEERCARMYARMQSGEPMTIEYIADQLGLSYEFFATMLAVYSAVTRHVPAVVDFSPARPLN